MNTACPHGIPNGMWPPYTIGMMTTSAPRSSRDGSTVRMLQNRGTSTSERACRALFDGQVDALGVTESQLPILLANDSVERLFGNSHDVEAAYFHKTQILPIMHVLAL